MKIKTHGELKNYSLQAYMDYKKNALKISKLFEGIELSESEEIFLNWLCQYDDSDFENALSIMQKLKDFK